MTNKKSTRAKLAQSINKVARSQTAATTSATDEVVKVKPRSNRAKKIDSQKQLVQAQSVRVRNFQSGSRVWPD